MIQLRYNVNDLIDWIDHRDGVINPGNRLAERDDFFALGLDAVHQHSAVILDFFVDTN
jgi:hypothetical protein